MKADGVDLATYTTFTRILSEGGTGKRGQNLTIPNRHGEHSNYRKWFPAANFDLEVGIKPSGTGEGYTNLSIIQGLLGKTTGLVTLERTTANGTMEADVELLGDPQPTQNRFTYVFPLRCPKGFWQDKTGSTASGTSPTVVTSGDRPIGDMVVTMSNTGTVTHTDAAGVVSTLTVDAAAGAGTYIIDVGARTVTKSAVNQDRYFTASQPWWLVFAADTTVSITSGVSITVDWKNKWAAG